MKLFGFIPVPQFGINLVNGEFFRGVVRKSFDEVDVDHDNELDHKELYIALLKVFDNLNEKLPCHVSVPPLDEINRLMAKYDVNSSGKLDFEEFLALTKSLIGTRKNWRDSLALKIAISVALKVAGFAAAAKLIKSGVTAATRHGAKLPLPVVQLAVESGTKKFIPFL